LQFLKIAQSKNPENAVIKDARKIYSASASPKYMETGAAVSINAPSKINNIPKTKATTRKLTIWIN
jgi:hypothetical protein